MFAAVLEAERRATDVVVADGEPAAVEFAAFEAGAAMAATDGVGRAPVRDCRCSAELVVSTARGDGVASARRLAPALAMAESGDRATAGAGSDTVRAACGLAVARSRVATLVGDTSPG